MNLKLLGTLSGIVALAVITFGAAGSQAAPSRQMARVFLESPTQINGSIVQGAVVIVHDAAKMAAGEACTSVYQYETGKGPGKLLSTFMCKPVQRDPVEKFTVSCARRNTIGSVKLNVMTEFQFAGETESHSVPVGN